jgi:hypothetical protein
MRSRVVHLFGLGVTWLALAVACGARTGLEVGREREVSVGGPDAHSDVHPPPGRDAETADVTPDTRLVDALPVDVVPDCEEPPVCLANNPGYVYKCGVPVAQCGLLEQCVEPCGKAGGGDACAAQCQNPCLNTLGQNTSNGCEFYAVEMDTTPESVGACYAVFVVNQWQTGQSAKLEVDLDGVPFSEQQLEGFARIPSGTGTAITYGPFNANEGLPQNQIAILFLSRDPNIPTDASPIDPNRLAVCPPMVTPAVQRSAAVQGTGIGNAFHIRTNVPIVAYQMLPYGGGHARITGATLLFPTNVWGTNYMAANAYSVPLARTFDGGPPSDTEPRAGPTMAIIAAQDDTQVTINPVVGIVGGGTLPESQANVPVEYTINQGEYLQFTQPAELTGSPIQSNKPIAVIGGSTLMDLPATNLRADSAEQMLPPISALGSEYVAVRYRSRDPSQEESVPWRMVGVVDGTTLTYDPAPPPGAPLTLNQGEAIEIDDPGPWVVSSQDADHPFYFAQYMTGGSYLFDTTSPLYGTGDPEFVNVVPPAQYLPSYVFFTDPTYPETNLVIVARVDPVTNQFPTVNLDCGGTLTNWQPVGTTGTYQFTRFDLSTGNFLGQNGCNNGVHSIHATLSGAPSGEVAAIGVTVWGWGSGATFPCAGDETNPNYTCWVSYAYPAGVNLATLNHVVVPAR